MRLVFGALFLVVALFHVESAAAQGNAEPGKKLWESVDARCRDCHGLKGEGLGVRGKKQNENRA